VQGTANKSGGWPQVQMPTWRCAAYKRYVPVHAAGGSDSGGVWTNWCSPGRLAIPLLADGEEQRVCTGRPDGRQTGLIENGRKNWPFTTVHGTHVGKEDG